MGCGSCPTGHSGARSAELKLPNQTLSIMLADGRPHMQPGLWCRPCATPGAILVPRTPLHRAGQAAWHHQPHRPKTPEDASLQRGPVTVRQKPCSKPLTCHPNVWRMLVDPDKLVFRPLIGASGISGSRAAFQLRTSPRLLYFLTPPFVRWS